MVFVPPEPSWNALLLVLNCGGGDAARRLANNRDSLSAIRDFIKFAPDWKALEVALGTPVKRPWVTVTPFPNITAAIVVEYARFLRLFNGVPHGSVSPPPVWPTFFEEGNTYERTTSCEALDTIWRFHSKRDSYAEDCLLLTGREIPYYQVEVEMNDNEPIDRTDGVVAYRRTFVRYEAVYGTPPSNVWPDPSALMALVEECQNHLDDCAEAGDDRLPCRKEVLHNIGDVGGDLENLRDALHDAGLLVSDY